MGLSILSLAAGRAEAGGLYFSDRGVRPMGRGGAFVAGADDLGAIYYNPAGMTDAPNQVLADTSWLLFHSAYTRTSRRLQFDPNDPGKPTGQAWDETYPTAEGTAPIIPIPTLAISNSFGLKNAAFALGLWAPYAAGARYEERLAGGPTPGRYMLVNLDGSMLSVPTIGAAYAPAPEVSVGATFQALIGSYKSRSVMTTCLPDRFVCAPEQPDFDSTVQMDVGPIFAPSANFGLLFKPDKHVRFGVAYQLGFNVDSDATIRVRMPSNVFFDRAWQDGDAARVHMRFPWIARVGVEVREIVPRSRAEIAYVREGWSVHDEITVTPQGMMLRDVELFPAEYRIGSFRVPRQFENTGSIRIGAEHWEKVGSYQIDGRIGFMYEKNAIPAAYLSTLTIDVDKLILGLGASLHVTRTWRLDGLYAHVFGWARDVSPEEARYPQINPVRATPNPYPSYVNGGRYEASAHILGVGLAVNYM
jgi:long-chain fatty acid transport protein